MLAPEARTRGSAGPELAPEDEPHPQWKLGPDGDHTDGLLADIAQLERHLERRANERRADVLRNQQGALRRQRRGRPTGSALRWRVQPLPDEHPDDSTGHSHRGGSDGTRRAVPTGTEPAD